jgi:excisionase family DNA binding protein
MSGERPWDRREGALDAGEEVVVLERPFVEPRRIACLLTKEDAAEVLKISTDGVDRLVKRGELPAIRIGGLVRFTPDDMEAFISANRQEVDP